MKRLIISIFATLLFYPVFAQDVIANLHNDFADIDTVAPPPKYKSIHMLGVKYAYNISGISVNPSIGEEYAYIPMNISLLYTYYHALWDYMPNFGVQCGIKYGQEGYSSTNEKYGEICKIVEVPLISQFRIDFSRFRLLVDLGTYYGYRLSTDKPGGFDQYDLRHDYGIIAGAGLAVIFKPLEIQIEGSYKYSLCSMYQTNKISDMYWIFAYPRNIMLSVSMFVHLW